MGEHPEMVELLTLTFAEIEFLLRAGEPEQVDVRAQLRLRPRAESDIAAGAGLASLLARGLCTRDGEKVVPADVATVLVAGLSTAQCGVRALGWVGDDIVLLHVFDGPNTRIALYPTGFGTYRAEPLDRTDPLSGTLTRFLDACLTGAEESAMLVQSASADEKISVAIAVDAAGDWFVSDTVNSPGHAAPATRDSAVARLAELFDVPVTVATGG